MTKIAFRVDGSTQLGMGHIMRCLGLAKILEKKHDVFFVSRNFGEAIGEIRKSGFVVEKLDAGLDEGGQINEALKIVKKTRPDILITDLFKINKDFSADLKRLGVYIISLDEIGETKLRSDIIINSSVVGSWHGYDRLYHVANFFIGPEYFLTKNLFSPFIKKKKRVQKVVRDILVIMGGADPKKLSINVLKWLGKIRPDDGFRIKLVVGPGVKHRREIAEAAKKYSNVSLLDKPANVARPMYEADLAICAGGFSLYELAAVGTPAVVLCHAEHELSTAEEMQRRGVCVNLGMGTEVSEAKFIGSVKKLIRDEKMRRKMSRSGKGTVDGRGMERVVKIINSVQKLRFRKAAMADCGTILLWRNDPVTRKFSIKNTKVIPYSEHLKWYKKAIRDPKRKLLMVEAGKQRIGVIRFDISDGAAEASINLAPNQRGKGHGRKILREGCLRAFDDYRVAKIFAQIKKENVGSINAFRTAGFDILKKGKIVVMVMNKI